MLELKNVTKTFNLTGNKEDLRVALDNVSLQIESGEFVTIIGGNGSGKSTTMNILTGVIKPDKGKVLLNDVDITEMDEHQRAGYFGHVFQDPMMGTSGDMSVLENLEIAYLRGRTHSPFKWGFKSSHKKEFIKELQRFDLGLEDRLNQKVGVMSGGQRQALTLLMATIRNKPTHKMIKRDYIKFSEKKPEVARKEFDDIYLPALEEYKRQLKNLKHLPKEIRKDKKAEFYEEFDKKVRQFDLTKQILLLDEHTAALDPKTAKKVLELTDKIVKENQMTTLMITHNMKDAITYGNRLIMFHMGHIIYDVKGEEKQKLTVEDLLKKFDEADKKAEQE
ncbi:MAG: ATP-binding cassette domain-containing protein [Bacilli bacterium]|nr:ATP-binding cassette domain-containing protein [Bacilli bacterium]